MGGLLMRVGGATVDTADIEALGPWLDYAWEQTK